MKRQAWLHKVFPYIVPPHAHPQPCWKEFIDPSGTFTALFTNLCESPDHNVLSWSFLCVSISTLDHEPLEEGRVLFVIASHYLAQCLVHHRWSIYVASKCHRVSKLKIPYLYTGCLVLSILNKGIKFCFVGPFGGKKNDCTYIVGIMFRYLGALKRESLQVFRRKGIYFLCFCVVNWQSTGYALSWV